MLITIIISKYQTWTLNQCNSIQIPNIENNNYDQNVDNNHHQQVPDLDHLDIESIEEHESDTATSGFVR